VQSALAQTVDELEVFIIGDGVSDAVRELIAELINDERVRFFDNPKGPRHGEAYRHAALNEAQGEIVCYLADDDLWLPNHVDTMRRLLSGADFANALPLYVDEWGAIHFYIVDLALPADRELIMSGANRIPLSCGAHTLEAYRNLPYGWRTTPEGKWTDLHMWQQFLANPECLTTSGTRPTVMNFPGPQRRDWSTEERLAELEKWNVKLSSTAGRESFFLDAHDALVRDYALYVARQRAAIANRQRHIEELKTSMQSQLRKLVELEADVANQSHRVQLLEQQLRDVHGSRIWKILSGLSLIREALRTRR
jgi:GalNAc5-diNAcBac-PP-undecaprenol beta-1,3-glucosyltransferase